MYCGHGNYGGCVLRAFHLEPLEKEKIGESGSNLFRMYADDIRRPFLVRVVSPEITAKLICISFKMLLPLTEWPWAAKPAQERLYLRMRRNTAFEALFAILLSR